MRISDWSSDVCSSDLLGASRVDSNAYEGSRDWLIHMASATSPASNASHMARIWVPAQCEATLMTPRAPTAGRGSVRLSSPEYTSKSSGEIGRASCRERVCQYV